MKPVEQRGPFFNALPHRIRMKRSKYAALEMEHESDLSFRGLFDKNTNKHIDVALQCNGGARRIKLHVKNQYIFVFAIIMVIY